MFKLIFGVLTVIIFINSSILAQELKPAQGKVDVVQDQKLSLLSEQYVKMSLNNPEIDGYRVQIFFDSGSNSKNKAAGIKGEFEIAYPGIKSYLSYKEPYYRVRVGDFLTLIEAVGFQKKIAPAYPNSFAVKDKIIR